MRPGPDKDADDCGAVDGPAIEIEREGTLTAIEDNFFVVGGIAFQTNPQTTYADREDNPLTRADFAVGECVEAEGTDNNGTVTAEKNEKRNADDCS